MGFSINPPILPSNQTPLGALPARFRRTRLLIIGCGDVGLRVVNALPPASGSFSRSLSRSISTEVLPGSLFQSASPPTTAGSTHPHGVRVLALTSSPARRPLLRAHGITPLLGDLDDATTLRRLAGLGQRVLHLAAPALTGVKDVRSSQLIHALRRRTPPLTLVYVSTSGVYGDCQGQWTRETTPPRPQTERAQRRLHAESLMRWLGRSAQVNLRISILRAPGIYANDRQNGSPRDRLLRQAPVLLAKDDVYTNHIHADDLARACIAAMWRGQAQRVYNVCDDSHLLMGDYFDHAADVYQLPRPPRISRATANAQLAESTLSFMRESRRMDNQRMKKALRLPLLFPTVDDGLRNTRAGRLAEPTQAAFAWQQQWAENSRQH